MIRLCCKRRMHVHRNRNKGGFTIIEVLVASVILAFASVIIFRAFFISISAIDEARDRLQLINSMHNTISEVKLAIDKDQFSMPYHVKKKVIFDQKPYNCVIKVDKKSGKIGLCSIEVLYYWIEGTRERRLVRRMLWPVGV